MGEYEEILECDFGFVCPKKWDNLTKLDDPRKRYCPTCAKEVIFVETKQEFEVRKKLGQCMAANVYSSEFGGQGITIMGGAYPAGAAIIHVFGETEDVSEVIVALDEAQAKRRKKQ